MRTLTVFSIKETDGYLDTHLYYVDDEEVAKEIVKTSAYITYSEEELVIYSSLEEITADNQRKLRETALAKLSRAEKKALGL